MVELKVAYTVDGRPFEGVVVSKAAAGERCPVLFMQPDWYGVCPETVGQAHELAELGYVVLLADMFGKDYGGQDKSFDTLLQGMLKVHTNLPLTLECGSTAYTAMLDEAKAQGLVDEAAPRFAVGYCAGAGFLMEQARSGEDFAAVAAFHITNPNPSVHGTPANFKGRVLAIHGTADPVTSREKLDALGDEVMSAGVEWQLVMFGGAVHSFCVPSANFPGAQYDEKLCKRSYRLMKDFYDETLHSISG